MPVNTLLRLFFYMFFLPRVQDDHIHRFDRIRQTVKRLRMAILLMAIMTLVGMCGYRWIEEVRWFDAYYMTVITLASVGYAEVFPMSDAGRLFTTSLIILNFGLFTYAISTITHVFAEGGFTKMIREYNMLGKIQQLKGHTLICGYGRHASEVTKELSKQGMPFVVVEENEKKISELHKDTTFLYVHGNATNDTILKEAGIERAANLVLTLPNDADNIFIIVTARQFNPGIRIICRASQPTDEARLLRAGADHVVTPERIGGFYMATLVNKPDLVEFFNLLSNMGPANVVFEEVPVLELSPKYRGRSIVESHLDTDCRIPVVAIRHKNGQYELNPSTQTVLETGMHIVVFGNQEQMQRFRTLAVATTDGARGTAKDQYL